MALSDLKREIQAVYKQIDTAGKAVKVQVQGKTAIIDGRPYPIEVAVPINVVDGKKVWVHVTGDRAVVIGD